MAPLLYSIINRNKRKGRPSPARLYFLLFFSVFLLLLIPLVFVTLRSPSSARADWYSSGGTWEYRKRIIIDNTKVSGSSDHSNFPLLFSLDDANLIDGAQSDGADILFTSSDGTTKLDHEIDSYSSGNLVAWVEIPTLSYNNDTVIYMYYGNKSASNQENSTGVWGDYAAVYHLQEDPSITTDGDCGGGSDEICDSTSNNNDGDSVSLVAGDSIQGLFGQAVQFDGTNDYITVDDSNSLDASAFSELTLSTWFNVKGDSSSDRARLIHKTDGSTGDDYALMHTENDQIRHRHNTGSLTDQNSTTTYPSTDNDWHYAVATWNGSNMYLYVDGVLEAGPTSQSSTLSNRDDFLALGGHADSSTRRFNGWLDESRISGTFRSVDWISTEYANQSDPFSFYTVDTYESYDQNDTPVAYWKFDEGQGSTANNAGYDEITGSITGAQWQSPDHCVSGSCLYFDGTGDYVDIGNNYDQGSNPFSISLWFRTSNTSNDIFLLNKGNPTAGVTGHGYALRIPNSWGEPVPLYYIQADGSAADSANNYYTSMRDGRWHQVTITRGASRIDMYLDGNLIGSDTSLTTSDIDVVSNLYIGAFSTGYGSFRGFIDEVKVFDYALSTSQVKANYAQESSDTGAGAVLGSDSTSSLSDGLVGYWKLDETSGNATDSSGNSTTLTNNNTTAYSSAKFGNGAELDGSADYFDVADNAILSITGSVTLAAWIEPDDVTGDQVILGKFDDADESYLLTLTGDELRMYVDSSSNYETTTATNLSGTTKYHVAGVYNPLDQTVDLYVNGVLQASSTTGTIPASIGDDAGEFALGVEDSGGTPANYFDGHIDEARVYNRALTAAEVHDLYDWAPGPILDLKLDDNTGTSTAIDSSGYGNNASLTSMTEDSWVPGKFNSALNFDGTADSAYVSGMDIPTQDFTYEFWVNLDNGSYRTFIDISSGSGNEFSLIYDNSIDVYFDHSYVFSASAISTGEWTHIAVTRSGSDVTVYINGVEDASGTDSTTLDFGSCGINIGFDVYSGCDGSGGGYLDGQLDEIKVYNYARTPKQITEDINAGHPAGGSPIGSQTVYYMFDEHYGSTANNSIETNSSITGSISGATWTKGSSCKYTNCLDFDGTDDVVTVTNADAIDMDVGLASGFTFTTWFNADSDGENNTGEIFQKGTNTYCRTDSESGGTADLECNLDLATTDANVNVSGGVTIGTWHHLALVYDDAAKITVYIDGVNKGSNTGSGDLSSDANNLLIGGNSGDNFDGTIDDFKIYPGALTTSQVLIDMNANAAINLGVGTRLEDDYTFTPPDPVLHWKFDENTGSGAFTTYDSTGNNLNGTAQSSMEEADWVPGVYSSALDFDGSNDNVSINNTGLIDFDENLSSGFSFVGWIYIHSDGGSSQGRIFQKGNTRCDTRSESGGFVRIACNTDMTGSDGFMNRSGVAMNQWHHFVFAFDGVDTSYLYLDGYEYGTSTGTGSLNTDTSGLYVGGGVNAYDGLIDDFKIFASELTPNQVIYEYNQGKPMAHWKFDECSGNTAYDTENGHNGTITEGGSGTNNGGVGTCDSGNGDEIWDNGTNGKFNASLDFDGTDDYITIADAEGLSPGDGDFTVSAWYKTSTDFSTSGWIYQDFGSVSNNEVALGMSEFDTITCIYMDGDADLAQASHSSTSNDGNWHHAACVRDGTTVNLYIDGKLVGTDTDGALGTIDVTGDDQAIGTNSASNGTQNFTGQIDEIKVFKYALSPAQVLNVYNGEAVLFK